MDFALSDEQEQLRDFARELVAGECSPEVVRKAMGSETGHDGELQRAFAEAGWLGVLVPERLGGAGLGLLDAALLLGEMGRGAVPGPFLASSVAAVVALRELGTPAQRKRWLPDIAAGETIATLAFGEGPEPRFDGEGVTARATRRGSGFELDGTKHFVDYAHCADLILGAFRCGRPRSAGGARGVSRRRTERAPAGRPAGTDRCLEGVGVFAVPAGSRGVRALPLVSVDETRRSCEVRFRKVAVPEDARLGARAGGAPAPARQARGLARVLDACAIAVAADSLGGAERALEMAVDYVKVREQFGRPVGSFQAVQHMAADCIARIEPARALLWYAAWAWDARPAQAPLAAAMAKAHLSDVYREVARTCVEMHGGIGFTWEHDMQLYFKRSLANAVAFGDADYHRERVARLARF